MTERAGKMKPLTKRQRDKFIKLWHDLTPCVEISRQFGRAPRWSVGQGRMLRMAGYDLPFRHGQRNFPMTEVAQPTVQDKPRLPPSTKPPAETFTIHHANGCTSTIGTGTLGMAGPFAEAFARAVQ